MKKLMIPFILILVLIISACSNSTKTTTNSDSKKKDTITYQSENGPVKVPAHPKRVVVLSSFAGNVMALGVPLVGVDSWSKMNPRFDSKLKNVEEVSDENLEKIIELHPDLIIGLSTIKNVDKLKKIAPTVTFTYGKVDYLTQHVEIGKLLNKQKEAQAWVDDFKQRAEKAGEEIRAKIGPNATVSVVENFDKQLYAYGDHWGRGTEILYQAMKLNMPEKVKKMVEKDGYYALSQEALPEYAGDYLILSKNSDTDNSFQETDTYKEIPAVKNKHVFEVNAKEFYFNDPLTLDYQLETFKKDFLGN
ncbi:iron-hydroxamate ABC transporter substrate-binding protein [Bacillus salipaludis]|uniref:Iron-hydroxamate ABC transporter substrate-binding protein n=1 Tax=Bacillus salipaludis TaxID=2547811 RepID=A0A4R5VNN1_9BACI|nr:iron-hydroxamate ABC transporter substrate-binding protein [Bacillus salipaludis]TDK59887.1 iron-hydroxamate ABC transporter substrate-binding protein [Bacillus salipaludis]